MVRTVAATVLVASLAIAPSLAAPSYRRDFGDDLEVRARRSGGSVSAPIGRIAGTWFSNRLQRGSSTSESTVPAESYRRDLADELDARTRTITKTITKTIVTGGGQRRNSDNKPNTGTTSNTANQKRDDKKKDEVKKPELKKDDKKTEVKKDDKKTEVKKDDKKTEVKKDDKKTTTSTGSSTTANKDQKKPVVPGTTANNASQQNVDPKKSTTTPSTSSTTTNTNAKVDNKATTSTTTNTNQNTVTNTNPNQKTDQNGQNNNGNQRGNWRNGPGFGGPRPFTPAPYGGGRSWAQVAAYPPPTAPGYYRAPPPVVPAYRPAVVPAYRPRPYSYGASRPGWTRDLIEELEARQLQDASAPAPDAGAASEAPAPAPPAPRPNRPKKRWGAKKLTPAQRAKRRAARAARRAARRAAAQGGAQGAPAPAPEASSAPSQDASAAPVSAREIYEELLERTRASGGRGGAIAPVLRAVKGTASRFLNSFADSMAASSAPAYRDLEDVLDFEARDFEIDELD